MYVHMKRNRQENMHELVADGEIWMIVEFFNSFNFLTLLSFQGEVNG